MFRVGISGWSYAGWRGGFYPPGLPHARELSYAAERMNSIEINGSFYSLQRPTSYRSWHAQTPEGFVFAVKGGRFITHLKKLAGVETALANFFASLVLALEEKLGPVLWQLPPTLGFAEPRIAAFLGLLPRSTAEAAALARHHDERVADRSLTETSADRPLRHAMEVRHPSFAVPAFVEMLRAHGVALVTADTAGKWPLLEDRTADFSYVRLHGDEELYVSGYSDAALDHWAARARAWAAGTDPPGARLAAPAAPPQPPGRDVFVYFDNDVKVRAPFDAMALAARLAGEESAPA